MPYHILEAAREFRRVADQDGADPGLHLGLEPEELERMLASGERRDLQRLVVLWNRDHHPKMALLDHGDDAEIVIGAELS